jgi:hypothetical protein
MALGASRLIGYLVKDGSWSRKTSSTGWWEISLDTDGPPTGQRRLSDWLTENAARVGVTYASEASWHHA